MKKNTSRDYKRKQLAAVLKAIVRLWEQNYLFSSNILLFSCQQKETTHYPSFAEQKEPEKGEKPLSLVPPINRKSFPLLLHFLYFCPDIKKQTLRMEFLKIAPKDTARWNKVWKLYEESFPLAECRKQEDHLRAFSDSQFFPLSAWEGSQLIGILFYWEWDSYRYLEYLAIHPELRGHGYGSQILRHLRDTEHTIILEIDPLINELSVRRLQFYERAGFTLTPYRFMHLPYRLEGQPIELLILSYPKMITKEQHQDFLAFLGERVILYCEGYPFEENRAEN